MLIPGIAARETHVFPVTSRQTKEKRKKQATRRRDALEARNYTVRMEGQSMKAAIDSHFKPVNDEKVNKSQSRHKLQHRRAPYSKPQTLKPANLNNAETEFATKHENPDPTLEKVRSQIPSRPNKWIVNISKRSLDIPD